MHPPPQKNGDHEFCMEALSVEYYFAPYPTLKFQREHWLNAKFLSLGKIYTRALYLYPTRKKNLNGDWEGGWGRSTTFKRGRALYHSSGVELLCGVRSNPHGFGL